MRESPGVLFGLQQNKSTSQQEIPIPHFFESRVSLPWLLWHRIKTSLPPAKLKTYCCGEEGEWEGHVRPGRQAGAALHCTAMLEPRRARLGGPADVREGDGPGSNLVPWSYVAWFI